MAVEGRLILPFSILYKETLKYKSKQEKVRILIAMAKNPASVDKYPR